MKTLLKTW